MHCGRRGALGRRIIEQAALWCTRTQCRALNYCRLNWIAVLPAAARGTRRRMVEPRTHSHFFSCLSRLFAALVWNRCCAFAAANAAAAAATRYCGQRESERARLFECASGRSFSKALAVQKSLICLLGETQKVNGCGRCLFRPPLRLLVRRR